MVAPGSNQEMEESHVDPTQKASPGKAAASAFPSVILQRLREISDLAGHAVKLGPES